MCSILFSPFFFYDVSLSFMQLFFFQLNIWIRYLKMLIWIFLTHNNRVSTRNDCSFNLAKFNKTLRNRFFDKKYSIFEWFFFFVLVYECVLRVYAWMNFGLNASSDQERILAKKNSFLFFSLTFPSKWLRRNLVRKSGVRNQKICEKNCSQWRNYEIWRALVVAYSCKYTITLCEWSAFFL